MDSSAGESIIVSLTTAEAMTVLAAVRQYEPYWPANEAPSATATRLDTLRREVESIIAKIRFAA